MAGSDFFWTFGVGSVQGNYLVDQVGDSIELAAKTLHPAIAARTFAIRGSESEELWSNPLTFYMSTPVLVGDTLVGFSDKRSGHFVLLDATTGETRWAGPPRQGENAAIVAAGDYVLTLTDDAELAVGTVTGNGLDVVRTYSVADTPTWAHPVPTTEGILIKDKETLALWSTQ